MKKYLGGRAMLKKTGRMDKVNRKIEMGGEVIKNPL
jgi:hypothetical protein